jgi:hypothetical protein
MRDFRPMQKHTWQQSFKQTKEAILHTFTTLCATQGINDFEHFHKVDFYTISV